MSAGGAVHSSWPTQAVMSGPGVGGSQGWRAQGEFSPVTPQRRGGSLLAAPRGSRIAGEYLRSSILSNIQPMVYDIVALIIEAPDASWSISREVHPDRRPQQCCYIISRVSYISV